MPIPESSAPEAFKAFEHDRWQSAARVYHDEFGRLTSQVAVPLLELAGVAAGVRHLDLASGPGYIAAESARRGARVTGTDFSAEMVTLARSLHRGVEFREADAEALPFDDASFDAVTMGFLLGHLARPAAAVREAWRVLASGGRLALAWWQAPERTIAFAIVADAVRRHGRIDVGLPSAPPFELFGNADTLRTLLAEAGFAAVEVREAPLVWRLANGEEMFDAYLNGTARTGGLLRAQSAEALAAIRAEVVEQCRARERAGRLELPMPAWLVRGEKR